MTLKKAIGSSVANFLRENIICRFGVPNKIISNNDTTFLNKDVRHLTEWYSISHMISTPYYPKGNGRAEASNKILLKILGKMAKENGKGWKEELFTALWAHRTAKSQATRASPFSLVYGTYPNRFSKASSETGRACRNTQRRNLGNCGGNARQRYLS